MLNAHALYKIQNAHHVLFPTFQLDVVRQLLQRNNSNNTYAATPGVARLSGKHFPAKVPRKDGRAQLRRCWVCSHTRIGQKKRRDSTYMCHKCGVGLCVTPCFQVYHEELEY
nr:unnamed protein product [Callosobruchus analis]